MQRRGFLLSACASALCSRAADRSLGTIAYLQADGLWVRDLPDGRPRKVSKGAKAPCFSPSGEWIAFDGGVVRSDGTAGASLPLGASLWLAQQDALAIATEDGLGLFSPRNSWSAPTATHKGVGIPVFNADGSAFVYGSAVRAGTGPGGERMRDGQLRRATLGGTESRTLLSQHLVLPIPYAWTRDSRFILYWEDPDFSASALADGLALFRVPVAGGPSEPLRVGTLVHKDLLALSPTENKLAVTAGLGREIYERKRIAIVDLETLALRYLTAGNASAIVPSWSPDGRRIAYVQAPVPPSPSDNLTARPYMGQRRIWVADALGATPPHPITSDDRYRDEEPLWSADGTHILFCRLDAAGAGTLWLMGAEGENPIPVSDSLPLKNLSGLYGYGFYGYIDWRGAFDWHRS
jgi:dipeptidyl aminopeptidase/acylaminoacyl peptidase